MLFRVYYTLIQASKQGKALGVCEEDAVFDKKNLKYRIIKWVAQSLIQLTTFETEKVE